MLCPCSSGKSYLECCQKYHQGAVAPTALALMRSRYSAYALGLWQYIIDTTYKDHPDWQKAKSVWQAQIQQFSKTTVFERLEILDASEDSVTFKAVLKQDNQDATFIEKSHFKKENDRWYYHSGELSR